MQSSLKSSIGRRETKSDNRKQSLAKSDDLLTNYSLCEIPLQQRLLIKNEPTESFRQLKLGTPNRPMLKSSNSIELYNRPAVNQDIPLRPETRQISQEQLVNEGEGIYTGPAMVEKKCVEIGEQQFQAMNKLSDEQWPYFQTKMVRSNFRRWTHTSRYLDPSGPQLPKISCAVLWKYVILITYFPLAFALDESTIADGSSLSDASNWGQLATRIRESLLELLAGWLFPLTISGSSVAVYLSVSQAKRSRTSEYLSAVFAVASLVLYDNRMTTATKICVFFSGVQFQYLNWQNWIKSRIPARGVRTSDLTFILFVAMVIDAGICALADSRSTGSDGFVQRYLSCTLAVGYVLRWAAFAMPRPPGLLPFHIHDLVPGATRRIEP